MKVCLRFLTLLFATLLWFACPSSQTPKCIPPPTVAISNITDSSITVNWDSVSGVTSYQLRLSKLVDSTYQLQSTDTVTGTTKIYNNLQPNTGYQVEVRSICKDGLSSPTTRSCQTGGVIIDDIVFIEPSEGLRGTNQCAANKVTSSFRVNGSQSLLFPKDSVMHIKILGNAQFKNFISEFTIVRGYNKSPNNAIWSIVHDACDNGAPIVAQEKQDIIPNQSVKLTCKRGNLTFELSFDRNQPNSFTLILPSGLSAMIEKNEALL